MKTKHAINLPIESQVATVSKNSDEDEVSAIISLISDSTEDTPNLQLPSPSLRNFYRDEAARNIWLQDEIDDSTMGIVKKIINYNKQDKGLPLEERTPIKLFIDTGGGDVTVMWALINTIKLSKTPVYTVNIRDALSAGAHILAAGHKRYGMPSSTVLIHSGSCAYSGTQEQAASAKKYYDAVSKQAEECLLQDTKISKAVLKRKAPSDWYLNAQEALENGIIDEIITDFDIFF